MSLKISLPSIKTIHEISTVGPLSTVRDPLTNIFYLTLAKHTDDDWDDDEEEDPSMQFVQVVGLSGKSIGVLSEFPSNKRMHIEESELNIGSKISHSDEISKYGLVSCEIYELKAGRNIQAIKQVRERTGLGLKDAKDLVDRYSW